MMAACDVHTQNNILTLRQSTKLAQFAFHHTITDVSCLHVSSLCGLQTLTRLL